MRTTFVPKAIIFDLYETLVTQYDPNWVPGPSIAERLGIDREAFSEAWKQASERRMCGAIPDFPSALREIGELLGHTLREDTIQQLLRERLDAHARPFAQIEDTILEMLQALHPMFRIGLLSNVTAEEVAAWEGCALAPWFDDIVFSYQVGLIKPDRRIYHLVCERLGVLPASAIFVGDGARGELMGAVDAGLTPYWATWFLDRWPDWMMTAQDRGDVTRFPRLRSPDQVVAVLARAP